MELRILEAHVAMYHQMDVAVATQRKQFLKFAVTAVDSGVSACPVLICIYLQTCIVDIPQTILK